MKREEFNLPALPKVGVTALKYSAKQLLIMTKCNIGYSIEGLALHTFVLP
jgi:hypothetical protein